MAINLGNIVGNSIQGISSGIDTAAVIKAASTAKQKQIDNLKDTLTLNSKKVTAFSDLKTSIGKVQASANFLRKNTGLFSEANNVFDYRKTTLSSSTLTASNYVSISASVGAPIGNFNIAVGNIAIAKQQRSASFNSYTTDATTSATGAYFTAGTFQFGSGSVQSVTGDTKSTDVLLASEYTVTGTGTGIVTSAGINNFVVTGGSVGQTSLQGAITSFTGTYSSSADTVVIQTTLNGVTYTSNTINTSTTIGSDAGIASGTTITFTADSGGVNETSFDITLASDVVINDSSTNVNSFLENLKSGVSSQSIFQSRQIENFSDANVKSPLTGLTNANIKFVSNSFNATTGEFGDIDGFTVQSSSGSDGAISVVINDETYRVTGLGTSVSSNLTLQSTTTNKKLQINLADAGVTLNLSSDANAQAVERAFDYAFGTRNIVDIEVESGDSLSDVVFNINARSSDTDVTASVVKVNNFDYRLSLKANNVGIDNSYEIFDTSGVFTNTSISSDIQEAEDAIISIDGVEISRSSNTISDAIDNVTLSVIQETPDYGLIGEESVSLNIENDIDTVASTIESLLNNYYDFRLFYAKQTERNAETSEFLESAVLNNDTTLTLLSDQLVSRMVGTVSNVSNSNYSSLTNLGITVDDLSDSVTETTTDSDGNTTTETRAITVKNAFVYDDTRLKEYLSSNYDDVRKIFEFTFTADSSDIDVYKSSNSITLNNFKLDIDTSRATGQQIKILNSDGSAYQENGEDVYMDYSAGVITGQSGTALDGLELIYAGDGVQTISISLSQGIADKIYNVIEEYTKDEGFIDVAVETVNESTTDTNTDITTYEDQLNKFVAALQAKFDLLEQAIANVNNLLNYLTAQDNARNNNN